MPTELWLPNTAQPTTMENPVVEEQRQLVEEFYAVSDKLAHFNRELQQIDPHLKVVLAKPNTTVMGLRPNFYHLVRMRPGHGTYIKVIETPDGEWRDLDSSIFDIVAEDDLWNDRTQRERRQRQRRADEARQRQRRREAQDRIDEFNARWHSATHVAVSVPKAVQS